MVLQYESSLQHHGVKGMKWGVRKQRQPSRITVRQAYKNAKESEREARRESLARDKADGATIRRAANNMNRAGREAMYESIQRDKAYNQQLRGQQQAQSWLQKNKKRLIIGGVVTGVVTAGVALASKKVINNYIAKNGWRVNNSYKFTPNFTRFKPKSSGSTFGNIYQRTAGFRGINRSLIQI